MEKQKVLHISVNHPFDSDPQNTRLQYRFAILLLLRTVDVICLTKMAAYTNHLFILFLFCLSSRISFLPWNESQSSLSCALAGDKMATKSLGNGLEVRTQINETGQKCATCSSEFSCGFSFLCSCERTLCVAQCRNQLDVRG